MRRIITLTIAIIILSASAVQAQTYEAERLYEKYRGEEGIISIWLPGIAMKLAANIADLDCEVDDLLRSIRSIRVLTIEDNDLYPDVNFTKEAAIKKARNGYCVLVKVSDGNEDVLILGREKRGKLKDLMVLVGGDENVMVQIKGRMRADLLGSVSSIAGLEDIKALSSL